MYFLQKINVFRLLSGFLLISSLAPVFSQSKKVNLVDHFKVAGIPVTRFHDDPYLSFTGYDYRLSAVSKDLKYMALARSYPRKESEIMEIVLVKIKNSKETVLLDTQTMMRYGRPNGFLYSLSFDNEGFLVAKIEDGMEGTSIVTFDPEKHTIVKDEYLEDYLDEGEEIREKINFDQKIQDLKRIFPKKNNIVLMDLAYKLMTIDSVGYLTQGILANDNSIFYLPHTEGKLRLIHNMKDPQQNDNINGIWGTGNFVFYLIRDKDQEYFFKYDIKENSITLLDKFPPHSHFTFINSYHLKNGDVFISFEVENKNAGADENLKLFRFSKGNLYQFEDYPDLKSITYLEYQNLLLFYYLRNGKQCLDVRIPD